jgi:hypothetical protein
VATHRKLADSGDAMTLDIAHGTLLGRIVAHEVGHALLLTLKHSAHGLMSPQLEQRTGPLDVALFALSTPDRERLAVRFSNRPGATLLASASPAAPAPVRRTMAAGDVALTPITWVTAPPAPSRPRAPR